MLKAWDTFLRLLLIAVISSNCIAVNPGFRTTITNKGLDYVRQVAIPILESALSSLSIPDISGDAGTPIGTRIEYSLSNIKLGGLTIPTSSLTSNDKGLSVQASGINMKANADWHYREKSWPHISDHGSCDVSLSGVSLSISVTVGADSTGHPTLSSSGCSLHIGGLDIHFHGGASWLYNLFSSVIAGSFKGSIQDQVCKTAVQEINTDGNKALESLPIVVKIDKTAEINYALLSPPTFTSSYVETNHKGEFYAIAKPVEAPFSPAPFPAVANTTKMLYVWLSQYIADSAGFVYQGAGILNYNVTPDMVPKELPLHLNTSDFKLLLPKLYSAYPNMGMILGLEGVKPPTLQVVPNSANFTVPGHVNVYVQDTKKNATELAFILGVTVYADVKVWVHANGSKEVVSANTTFLKADLSLVQSNIGTFTVSILQTAVNLLSTSFVIPVINGYANAGLTIPVVDGVSFVNAEVTLGQEHVLVSTDFSYKPTFLHKTDRL